MKINVRKIAERFFQETKQNELEFWQAGFIPPANAKRYFKIVEMIGRDTVGKSFTGNEKYYQNIPWR